MQTPTMAISSLADLRYTFIFPGSIPPEDPDDYLPDGADDFLEGMADIGRGPGVRLRRPSLRKKHYRLLTQCVLTRSG